jgi:sterol desaturase/sphingolipid hydroxylase (fatty acid hydroxylase superfamily)
VSRRRRGLERELPGWVAGAIVVGAFAAMLGLELKAPLRRPSHGKVRRDARNLAMAAMSAAAIHLVESPLVGRLSRLVARRRWGLVPRLGLPAWAEVALVVVLMDYTLYVWHVLTHKVPLLARFHRVHHADLDMDVSTAVRFHFGEMLLSVPWRAGQVALIGAAPRSLSAWTILTTAAILFHHSNARLPFHVERWLCRVVVTPRMHGIHHSIVQDETDANWSTIFTLPDFLHRTMRLDVPQDRVTIGLPTPRDPRALTLGRLVAMPVTAGDPAAERPPAAATRARPGAPSRWTLAP